MPRQREDIPRPGRLLVVMPTWVGDAVMATPALRLLRNHLPGAFIGALVRPGVDAILAGTSFFDDIHIEARAGVMGPKRAAAKVRPLRYDTALLLTNSFSSALTTRIAGIPRRVGYERDGRSFLLTAGLVPPKRGDTPPYDADESRAGEWAPVPACTYYQRIAAHVIGDDSMDASVASMPPMELATTEAEEEAAAASLQRAGIGAGEPFAVLNPGGNNPAKRWPAERFAQLADYLFGAHQLRCIVSGSPAEAELTEQIARSAGEGAAVSTADLGVTLASLKAIVRCASIMVTNDTGPRHIAAAFGVPVVSLFGPTDCRWTTIPHDAERILVADPTLPAHEVANDDPARNAIERIGFDRVQQAVDALLVRSSEGTPRD